MPASGTPFELTIPAALQLGLGESLTFGFRREGYLEQGFVLRLEAGFVAYANRCPHWNVDLDLGDERFYDQELDRIYCKNHGATFLASDGRCDAGPCLGRSLEQFATTATDEGVLVQIPDGEPP